MKITISKKEWDGLSKEAAYYGSEFSGNLMTYKTNLQAANKFIDLIRWLDKNIELEANTTKKEEMRKKREVFIMTWAILLDETKEPSKRIDEINRMAKKITKTIWDYIREQKYGKDTVTFAKE